MQVPTLDLPGMMSPKVLADDRETSTNGPGLMGEEKRETFGDFFCRFFLVILGNGFVMAWLFLHISCGLVILLVFFF